jgi:hypothetical protein
MDKIAKHGFIIVLALVAAVAVFYAMLVTTGTIGRSISSSNTTSIATGTIVNTTSTIASHANTTSIETNGSTTNQSPYPYGRGEPEFLCSEQFGFTCNDLVVFSNGTASFKFAQDSGHTYYNVHLACLTPWALWAVPANIEAEAFNATSSIVSSTMQSGVLTNISILCYNTNGTLEVQTGSKIWVAYSTSPNGPKNYSVAGFLFVQGPPLPSKISANTSPISPLNSPFNQKGAVINSLSGYVDVSNFNSFQNNVIFVNGSWVVEPALSGSFYCLVASLSSLERPLVRPQKRELAKSG